MNESDLILNMQQGDSESFRKIFDLYECRAVKSAYLITRNQSTKWKKC